MDIKKIVKKMLFIAPNYNLTTASIVKSWNERFGKYIYRKKFNSENIGESLLKLGIKRGDNIFVHCSWSSFYNYVGSEQDFLKFLIDYIGPDGTIAMPAYTFQKFRGKSKFRVLRSVTAAGVIPEFFRKYPGVERSENPQHSVCALGPLAHELLKDHFDSMVCFDELSPYCKISQLGFKIVTFGMNKFFVGTIVHTVEGTLYKELPYFADFIDTNTITHETIIDKLGNEKDFIAYKRNELPLRTEYLHSIYYVKRYFDKKEYGSINLSGLNISFYNAHYTHIRMCELARKGIIYYITPKYHS